MAYEYKVMTQDKQDDIVVSFLASQEREKFSHETDLTRYNAMLASLPDGPGKTKIQQLRDDIVAELVEIDASLAATANQIPEPTRLVDAQNRLNIVAAT